MASLLAMSKNSVRRDGDERVLAGLGGRIEIRRSLHQEPDDAAYGLAQIMAVDNHIDHAVCFEILSALKAFRQFFADRLLDDARSGKADERSGLGDMDIAQHGIRRGDAA